MIRGQLIHLRPIEREDLPTFVRWFGDEEIMSYIIPHWPFSMAEEEAWFERVTKSETDKVFAVCTTGGKLIGTLGLHGINTRNGSAELGIVICDKECWGKGYGTDAVRTMLRFAFEEMRFHRIQLHVHEDNARAIKAYEKCGFVREGVVREQTFRGGRWTNGYLMSTLAHEWLARK